MTQNKLTKTLSKQLVFGDGAMGTMLYVKGVFINTCFEELNLTRPQLVAEIHDQYISAGAEFAITQPVFDEESFFKFLELTSDCKIPIIAGIWPFTSYKNAEFMANEAPCVVVPPKILEKMSRTKDARDGRKTGVQIALDLMNRISDNVAGFAISAPFGNVKMALAAAEKIDINQI